MFRAAILLSRTAQKSKIQTALFSKQASRQSRTQSPQAFWSAGRRQERLWDNGISYPRKRGIPVFVRMLKIKTEVKCPKMAVVLMFSGLKVLSGLESVRESQSWFLHAIKGTGFFPVRADQSNWIFYPVRASERWT